MLKQMLKQKLHVETEHASQATTISLSQFPISLQLSDASQPDERFLIGHMQLI